MLNRIKSEPVVITTLVRALVLLVTAFGLDLSAEQVAAIMFVVEALLALFTRAAVTPYYVDPGTDPADDGPAPDQD